MTPSPVPTTKIAGRKLREIREGLGLRMADVESESVRLSKLFGNSRLVFHTSALSEMEARGRPPSLHRAYVLSLIYEVDLQGILALYGLPDLKPNYSNEARKLRLIEQEIDSLRQRRCEQCGQPFTVPYPACATRFCSRKCAGIHRSALGGRPIEKRLRRAVARGIPYKTIAESLQISRQTLHTILTQLGISRPLPRTKHRIKTSAASKPKAALSSASASS